MIKTGVDLRGLTPQMALAYSEACWVYYKTGGYECVITSGGDGEHKPKSGTVSLHKRNGQVNALDLRTKHLADQDKGLVTQRLKIALGSQFYVELEHLDQLQEHLHVEFDPKDPVTVEA